MTSTDQAWIRRAGAWGDWLRCVTCGGLAAVTSKGMHCSTCGHDIPASAGILRQLAGHAFDAHWEGFVEPIAVSKRTVAEEFLAPMLARISADARILDAGCGDGVHLAILGERCTGPVAGLDVSGAALAAAASRNTEALLLQADMASIPLADGCCDAVFSFGAIAYTEHPSATIRELVRVLRPGGLLGFWMYPRPNGISGTLLGLVRTVCRWGGRWFTRRIADLLVPLLQWLPTRSRMHLGNASWVQCREVVLVNIAPVQLVFPTRGEIADWCANAGLDLEVEDTSSPVTLWLSKRAPA